jgi:hypothetical protein
MENLSELSDDALLSGLESLIGSQRQLLAGLLRYLVEVEERRLHLQLAYGSMFEFCTVKLGMSEGEAFRRIAAARLAKSFPIVIELVASGALHLSGLVLLRDHLMPENCAELLSEACGKSKAAIAALLAARFPKPDVASKMRKLPAAASPAGIARNQTPPALSLVTPADSPKPAEKPVNARLEPLSAARFKVQFTAGQQLKDKLERAKHLLSHSNPSGDLAVVVERALDLLLAELEKKKLGKSKRPRRSSSAQKGRVTRAARRQVFERDGEQCSFVGPNGRRCQAKAFLEVDHVESRALGGSDESHNLRIYCLPHNRLWAEQTFGKAHVQERINLRQRKLRTHAPRDGDETYDKLLQALIQLGFGRKETCGVLGELRSGRGAIAWTAPTEQLLRAAVQLLTQ